MAHTDYQEQRPAAAGGGNTLLNPTGDPLLDLELAREAELAAAR